MTRANSYFDRLRGKPRRVKLVSKLGVKGVERSAVEKVEQTLERERELLSGYAWPPPQAEF